MTKRWRTKKTAAAKRTVVRIPPRDAPFVWRMEDVLDLYAEPYKPWQPVVCSDERPRQLVSDSLEPLPRKPGRAKRVDYEYDDRACAMPLCSFNPGRAGAR